MNIKEVGTTKYGSKILECPVCKAHCIEQGLKNHIVGTAKGELFDCVMERGNRSIKHLKFLKKNTRKIEIKKLILTL